MVVDIFFNIYSPMLAIKNRFFLENAAETHSQGSLRDGGGLKVNARLYKQYINKCVEEIKCSDCATITI